VSYFKHDAEQSRYFADRLPIYVFPAFVGSGRILLGMALSGITTAVMLHSKAGGEPIFWWMAIAAYASSLVLVVSGIYAVNVIPEQRKRVRRPLPPEPPPPRVKPLPKEPVEAPPVDSGPERRTRIGDLLVEKWQLLSSEQLARAEGEQEESGRSLIYVLAKTGLLTDDGLEKILDVQSAAADPWHDAPRRD
jgi:hypothetical protein